MAAESTDTRIVLLAVDGSRNSENAFHLEALVLERCVLFRWQVMKMCQQIMEQRNLAGYVTHLHTVNTKLILLNVYEMPTLQSGAYHSEPDSDFQSWKTRISEVQLEAEKIVKRFLDKCAAYKDLVHYTPAVVAGKPGEIICQEATKRNVNMIIIGSRGLGRISRSLFGSVSDYVVRRACLPVVVVPKGCKTQ